MLKGIWNESQHIKAHIRSLPHVFTTSCLGPDSCGTGVPKNIWLHHQSSHTCASTCLCYKVAWGHSVRGPKFGARSSGPDSCGTGMPKNIWLHHQSSHTCASTCLCYKVAWGHSVRGPKFGARSSGPDSCGTGMPKNIWLHHQNSHTCASTYMPLLQSCLGAPRSGPEVRGPTLVA